MYFRFKISLKNLIKHILLYLNIFFYKIEDFFNIGSYNIGKIKQEHIFRKITSKKLCIFSHFDKNSQVAKYVLFYMQSIKNLGFNILFVSTSDFLNNNEIDKLSGICNIVLVKENKGIDFGSWCKGIEYLKLSNIHYNSLLLCNDSVYFPLHDPKVMFEVMNKKQYDIWGVTDSHEIKYHMQSYFMMINESVLKSIFWKDFWNEIRVYKTKSKTVYKLEIGFSQKAIKSGFSIGSYCNYLNIVKDTREKLSDFSYIDLINTHNINPTHFLWDILIGSHKCPILKVDLLRTNLSNISTLYKLEDVINDTSCYDIALIKDHLDCIKY